MGGEKPQAFGMEMYFVAAAFANIRRAYEAEKELYLRVKNNGSKDLLKLFPNLNEPSTGTKATKARQVSKDTKKFTDWVFLTNNMSRNFTVPDMMTEEKSIIIDNNTG